MMPWASEHAVDGVGFQILGRRCRHLRISGEDPGERHSVEEGSQCHEHADAQRRHHPDVQRLPGTGHLSGAGVLRHKGGHGLHERGGHQHDEGAHALGTSHTGGGDEPQGVDDGHDDEKGDPHEEVLQRDGKAQPGDPADHRQIRPHVPPVKFEGQLSSPDDLQGDQHGDELGKDGGQRRAGSPHLEHRHQKQISQDIDPGGNGHGDQRRTGIPDAPEHTAQQIVGGDDQSAGSADPHIGHSPGIGLLRRVHDGGDGSGKQDQKQGHDAPQHDEFKDAGTDDLSALLHPSGADLLSQQDGGAHGKARHEPGDEHHDLGAGGHGGYIRGGGELPHDEKVHRAVHRLQKQRRQHRQ